MKKNEMKIVVQHLGNILKNKAKERISERDWERACGDIRGVEEESNKYFFM